MKHLSRLKSYTVNSVHNKEFSIKPLILIKQSMNNSRYGRPWRYGGWGYGRGYGWGGWRGGYYGGRGYWGGRGWGGGWGWGNGYWG